MEGSHLIDHHRDPVARLIASRRAVDECILHGLAVEHWCKRSLDAVDGIFWGLHCSILKSRAPVPLLEADGSPGNPHRVLSTFVQSTRRAMGWVRFSVRVVKLIFGWLKHAWTSWDPNSRGFALLARQAGHSCGSKLLVADIYHHLKSHCVDRISDLETFNGWECASAAFLRTNMRATDAEIGTIRAGPIYQAGESSTV